MTEERQDRYCACGSVMNGDGAICALCSWTVLYTDKTWTTASSMARVAQLEAENIALRARLAQHPDTELLDWLESNPTNLGDIENKSAFPDGKWRLWSNGQEAGALGVGKTLREAIAEARKEKP